MVAVKGRVNSITEGLVQDQKKSKREGQVDCFKIYVEADKVKKHNVVAKGKSIPHNSGSCLVNDDTTKRGSKNLEKGKSKMGKYVDSKVGRKVLADIGNVKGTSWPSRKGKSENMVCQKRSGKSEVMPYRERNTFGLGNMEATSSHITSRDSNGSDLIEATGDNQTGKKSSVSKKVTYQGARFRIQGRSSAFLTVRKRVENPPHLTRKSLPAPRPVSRVETNCSTKENSEKESSTGKHGFPVKPRKSTASKPNNPSSRPWGNRTSDGFVVMASRAPKKLDTGALSRKFVRPSLKTTKIALSTQRNSISNQTTVKKSLKPKPANLPKRKQDKVSVSKDIPSDLSQVESTSKDEKSGTIAAKRKSDRRNSFTCSLMSRSKLIKGGKVIPQETLPNIYDDHNPLEVSDYVDDIYQYYWVLEGRNPLLKNYMEMQKDITPHMRGILINWLIEVHQKFDLMEETLFLTITLLDRYLSLENIKKNEFQLVGLTAFLLASKYEDFWHPRVGDLISIAAESYTREQMLQMEKTMLKKLMFRLNEPTPYVFMLRFLKAAKSDMKKFEHLAFYLIELCLVEYEALNYKPSMLCASAIYVARCTLRMSPPWTPLIQKYACYEESLLRDCSEMILKFHKAAKTSLLKVTYEKYMKADCSRVATIKPLDRLPACTL